VPVVLRAENTEYPTLSGNKMKHYISEMKADIKCATSFNMETLPLKLLYNYLNVFSIYY